MQWATPRETTYEYTRVRSDPVWSAVCSPLLVASGLNASRHTPCAVCSTRQRSRRHTACGLLPWRTADGVCLLPWRTAHGVCLLPLSHFPFPVCTGRRGIGHGGPKHRPTPAGRTAHRRSQRDEPVAAAAVPGIQLGCGLTASLVLLTLRVRPRTPHAPREAAVTPHAPREAGPHAERENPMESKYPSLPVGLAIETSRTDRSGLSIPFLGVVLLGLLLATTAARGQTHRRAETPPAPAGPC